MKQHVLIVDDDDAHRKMLETVLANEGYLIDSALSGEMAVKKAERGAYNLILMDVRMQGMDGIEAMRDILYRDPDIPIIIMTAYGSINDAVDAIRSGARDYITKPIDLQELKVIVTSILDRKSADPPSNLAGDNGSQASFPGVIGQSKPMRNVLELAARVAPTDATVLILGESGTGKEVIADIIHQQSLRKKFPFIKVNCAALPESLLESELFGHEKGAFTGAIARKDGRFRNADKGTIFLDEIAEMSVATQAKLLRVIQERAFEPLGGSKTVTVDIRVIAATNKVLEEEIQAGTFREDLFYRLNVVTLTLPPLRNRPEDISLLAEHFLKKFSARNHRRLKGFSPQAMDLLCRYTWPGNIRELENAVERAVILARHETILAADMPADLCPGNECSVENPDFVKAGSASLKDMEKMMIRRTLEETDGNRTRAAQILGISRRTLQLKLKSYDD